jgi:hypothetical protein
MARKLGQYVNYSFNSEGRTRVNTGNHEDNGESSIADDQRGKCKSSELDAKRCANRASSVHTPSSNPTRQDYTANDRSSFDTDRAENPTRHSDSQEFFLGKLASA